MARYPADHKVRSRQKLVQAAADLFRARGFEGVGIDELCASAGMTRGAFYGHFASKAALLGAVLTGAHDFVCRLQARTATTTRALRRQAAQVARDYLAPSNRDAVVRGCSLASLALDATRGDAAAREAYARAVRAVIAEFRRGADGELLDADAARAALALCVGGLLIDNGCGDDPEGRRVARAAQKLVTTLLNDRL